MTISPFTPLFFDTRKSDGIESRYTQLFASSDQILVEFFVEPEQYCNIFLVDEVSGQIIEIYTNSYDVNDSTQALFSTVTGLANGYYRIFIPKYIASDNLTDYILPAPEVMPNDVNAQYEFEDTLFAGVQSEVFRVTNDAAELADTSLIQYSMKDNKQRTDALFIVDGMRYFFDFRVPGGFKDSNWTFAVENEQFVTADGDIVELYAKESTSKKFTMGGQEGVPVVFGELLNRLLTCSYVYIDGERYARKDTSVPEMNVQMEGLDSFVFNQALQKVNYLNPSIENDNQVIIRRVDSTYYRTTDGDQLLTV